jgi:hypothetical protein
MPLTLVLGYVWFKFKNLIDQATPEGPLDVGLRVTWQCQWHFMVCPAACA